MTEIELDLKELRKRLKKTQEEMAAELGISQPQYNRYEKNPSLLSFGLFQKLAPYLGNLNELKTTRKLQAIDLGQPYQQFLQKQKYLFEYIDKSPLQEEGADTPKAFFTPDKLKQTIFNVARKPNIGLYGEFDAGKTHLVNCLLGQNKFNANYRPTTSLITCIRHVDDKPEWLNESVAIMNKSFSLSCDYANSEEAWNKHCLYKGNLAVLDEFGIHQGTHKDDKPCWLKEAYYAVVYFDSPILRACNILDTPGYGSNIKEDLEKANIARNSIDILLFLTTVSGSFNQRDLLELSSLLKELPRPDKESDKIKRFSNLYFVITRTDDNILDDQINHIVESASSEIVSYYPHIFTAKERDQEVIKQRIFPFWSESPGRRDPLFSDIKNLLALSMPLFIEENTKKTINQLKDYGKNYFKKQVNDWERLIKDQSEAKFAFEELTTIKKENLKKLDSKRGQVLNFIEDTSFKAKINFEDSYDDIMNIENISTLLTEVYGDDSKKAQSKGVGLVNERLLQKMSYEVDSSFEKIVDEFDEFVEHFPLTEGASNSIFIEMPFDKKGAFWGAVTSGVVGGGLMLAASASNLGGYAVAASAVSLLSAGGVSFAATGGTSGVMSIIAMFGGPVTVGIALAVLGGLFAWRLAGDNWESRLSKKIIKSFEAENTKTEMSSKIEEILNDLVNKFEKNYIQLQEDYEDYLIQLRDIGNGDISTKELEEKIKAAREKKSFFENNSWDDI